MVVPMLSSVAINLRSIECLPLRLLLFVISGVFPERSAQAIRSLIFTVGFLYPDIFLASVAPLSPTASLVAAAGGRRVVSEISVQRFDFEGNPMGKVYIQEKVGR